MKKISIKKVVLYAYMAWIAFGLIPLIGVSMASYFETMYEVFTYKWLALGLICFFFGSISTVLPMYLTLEPSLQLSTTSGNSLNILIIIGWIAAFTVPFLGFEFLSLGLIVTIYLTTFPSLEELSSSMRNKTE